MAAGDIYSKNGVETVAANSYFDIVPIAGQTELVVHNISHSLGAELQYYDGTNAVTVDIQTGNGSWMGMFLHCTATRYYRVKSAAAGCLICCDGVVSK